MKYLNLLLLIGLSAFVFSCDDDDDDANPQDVNPIYFETDTDYTVSGVGNVESIQINFNHEDSTIRIVAVVDPEVSVPTVDEYVYDFTLTTDGITRSDDYSYSITVMEGDTYTRSLKANTNAGTCVSQDPDPEYGVGVVAADQDALANIIVWDDNNDHYEISTASLLSYIFGFVDPGFSNFPDSDFGNMPNLEQSEGSIKGCEELPTTFK